MLTERTRALPLVAAVMATAAFPSLAFSQFQFEDRTASAGLTHSGESWGASWGDGNNDGFPDLFVNNHRERPELFINNGDGSFTNKAQDVQMWRQFPTADQHGGAWADFDNDNDLDLFVSTGTRDDVQFLVNTNGILSDRGSAFGLDGLRSLPGRLPVWLDYNDDGRLDFMYMKQNLGKSRLYRQDAGSFTDVTNASGTNCSDDYFGMLSDLDVDGRMELLCGGFNVFPDKIYDTSTFPFTDVTGSVPPAELVNDAVVADLDGNLRPDLFYVRGAHRISEAAQTGPSRVEAQLITSGVSEKSFHFRTTGVISLLIDWLQRNRTHIYIGATGWNPSGFGPTDPVAFSLDPADNTTWGIKPHDPAVDGGIYIGYDPATQLWDVVLAAANVWNYSHFFIDSTQSVSDVTITRIWGSELPIAPQLLMNRAGGFTDETVARGLGGKVLCASAVAADLDNDMDLDLYLACRGGVTNIANRLYENLGDGTFREVAGAAGAAGPVGVNLGGGEAVVASDYDLDGYVDLYVTNGINFVPEPPDTIGGPNKVFRNRGSGNHWVEIDLIGRTSNRTGVGARVIATAGGKSQLREQNGQYHRFSQNDQRLHFGLAGNTLVDLRVEWPSGTIDTFTGVAADRLYRVTEGGAIEPFDPGTVPPPCSAPTIDGAVDSAIFIWKDCASGQWRLRATAGSAGQMRYAGSLVADQPFTSVTPVSIEGSDVLNTGTAGRIDFALEMWSPWDDGFNAAIADSATLCLNVDLPANATVLLGSNRVQVTPPVNPATGGTCTQPSPTVSVADVSTSEGAGQALFTVTLSPASNQTVSVDVATADGTATAPADYTAVPLTTLQFAPGESSKTVAVVIADDALNEGEETFTLNLGNVSGATLGNSSATGRIVDNEISPCGMPVYDAGVDGGIFLWKDCASGQWSLRATAGLADNARYLGTLTSDQPFLYANGYSIEPGDVFDASNPNAIQFDLRMWRPWDDGFDFAFPDGANVCLSLQLPAGASATVGQQGTPIATPFDLTTFAHCTP